MFSRRSQDNLKMSSRCSQMFSSYPQDVLTHRMFSDICIHTQWKNGEKTNDPKGTLIWRMDFDNQKVYGDTFISDGLVSMLISSLQNILAPLDFLSNKSYIGYLWMKVTNFSRWLLYRILGLSNKPCTGYFHNNCLVLKLTQ